MEKSLFLCLREDLIAPTVSLRQLAHDVNQIIVTPISEISVDDARGAFEFIQNNKGQVQKNAEGCRMLEQDDPIRPSVCRILFHIPLANLLRREKRISKIDPDEAVIKEDCALSSDQKRRSKKTGIPPHTVEIFKTPDEEHAFDGYVGNNDAVRIIKSQLLGAEKRGDPMPMLLLRGPSGVGKTELAIRAAKFLGRTFYYVSGAALKTGDDVRAIVDDASIQSGKLLLFVDEIQGARDGAQTALLTIQRDLESLGITDAVIVFASNLCGQLLSALKNRCTQITLREYSVEELCQIIEDSAKENGVTLENGVSNYVAKRCNSIARYAKNYLAGIISSNGEDDKISRAHAQKFFEMRGIDELGLGAEHRQYIRQLSKLNHASAQALASSLGENDTGELINGIEPLLLKHGLINITSKGRILTEAGRKYAESIA